MRSLHFCKNNLHNKDNSCSWMFLVGLFSVELWAEKEKMYCSFLTYQQPLGPSTAPDKTQEEI